MILHVLHCPHGHGTPIASAMAAGRQLPLQWPAVRGRETEVHPGERQGRCPHGAQW
jgi:hypothetical protein